MKVLPLTSVNRNISFPKTAKTNFGTSITETMTQQCLKKINENLANKISSTSISSGKFPYCPAIWITDRQPVSQIVMNFKDKNLGKTETAIVSFFNSGENDEDFLVTCQDKFVGLGSIYKASMNDFLNIPDIMRIYMPQKADCLYIEIMRSQKQGIGTIMHKAIAKRSQELGFDGNVLLTSAFASAPFHYSCGFRELAGTGQTKRIPHVEELLNLYKQTGKRIEGKCGVYEMLLTPEKANELLNR